MGFVLWPAVERPADDEEEEPEEEDEPEEDDEPPAYRSYLSWWLVHHQLPLLWYQYTRSVESQPALPRNVGFVLWPAVERPADDEEEPEDEEEEADDEPPAYALYLS
ncbi:hypothetical protein ADK38_40600 [Streptomyces varsoviensis]|uniref:Uncharacterized protein n=1 Tax=Streptomyces varsoviensis TaxID=67373 RepID=A0ABR5IUB0_9ACTN|nr:hypothetical protein ADK38_40600 [Streptomyces varsoviensis]